MKKIHFEILIKIAKYDQNIAISITSTNKLLYSCRRHLYVDNKKLEHLPETLKKSEPKVSGKCSDFNKKLENPPESLQKSPFCSYFNKKLENPPESLQRSSFDN